MNVADLTEVSVYAKAHYGIILVSVSGKMLVWIFLLTYVGLL